MLIARATPVCTRACARVSRGPYICSYATVKQMKVQGRDPSLTTQNFLSITVKLHQCESFQVRGVLRCNIKAHM